MTGEEVAGPAAPKVLRLLYFVGAGFICTAAINKWRQLERKAMLQKQQGNQLPEDSANAVQKAVD
ncbi:uncharacterized protein LOC121236197 [Juglans microcarpa x Juglans regia]|uniref:Uncharacterized protein LOC109012164 n=2 Tax=Juglans regia TaxID=51240 RepID=A0A2I4GZ95_JUGRE|nr:uncharacterized protein LOC109012164 [Juglans regia]XP_018849234.1 uncharacterized protein LOC109012164 [Juglans regia]XP_018849240.1 uncharacterized protein LOC109012164 [Juglans regia]XP_035542037.1 uncharacterized protein LOC109012164 [Juglans regia]XP_040988667.1 uncharacterized protein LOC121236197 [Juglans microcarpa x Juglans regia]XP_040988668.1 uncharacterized protein LOC121236197 [Juglans microcarpa x Juglans regia]